jgi:hypothetical protein
MTPEFGGGDLGAAQQFIHFHPKAFLSRYRRMCQLKRVRKS